MKSTREKVLHTLVTNPRSTVIEIAENVGINAISVRHHLTNLQANGLVSAEEERHGVGRPRLVYFLTESGQERFPKRYFRLSDLLINQIKKVLSKEEVGHFFENMADGVTNELNDTIEKMDMPKRLDLLKSILANEGYEIKIQKSEIGYEISGNSCPYYQLGKAHPEICFFDKKIISNVLLIPTDSIVHKKHGDNHCTFNISEN